MKKQFSKGIFCICLLMTLTFSQTKAQFVTTDPTSLAQRIVLFAQNTIEHLERLQGILDGVQKATDIFAQGKEWYDHLKNVVNTVKTYQRVVDCVSLLDQLGTDYANAYSKIRQDPNLRPAEIVQIGAGYTTLISEGIKKFGDLDLSTTATDMSMTDKERLDMINKVYDALKEHLSLLHYYTQKTMSITYNRAKAANNISTITKLYGL